MFMTECFHIASSKQEVAILDILALQLDRVTHYCRTKWLIIAVSKVKN